MENHSHTDLNLLEAAYQKIRDEAQAIDPAIELDSFDVVADVEKLRQAFRPKNVKVILLCESHVSTSKEDHKIIVNYDQITCSIFRSLPTNFVRFVYCLGYGENELLEALPGKNTGTPQYWKLLASCQKEPRDGFADAFLKSKNRDAMARLNAKADLLRTLRDSGVWLVDASIVGVYASGGKKPSNTLIKKILKTSFHHYVRRSIEDTQPEQVIIVGTSVRDALIEQIREIVSPNKITTVCQPNARIDGNKRQREMTELFKLCLAAISVAPQ
jgi:hypothetical protein